MDKVLILPRTSGVLPPCWYWYIF